jgi:hypothetical protein
MDSGSTKKLSPAVSTMVHGSYGIHIPSGYPGTGAGELRIYTVVSLMASELSIV